jgi:hypothetical protein
LRGISFEPKRYEVTGEWNKRQVLRFEPA